MTNSSVSIIVDSQAGSSGKGKVAAFLGLRHQPDIAIANFGPNAGHTVWMGSRKLVFRHLPASAVYHGSKLAISAGALLDLTVLRDEIREMEAAGVPIQHRLHIHPRAMVIEAIDQRSEDSALHHIASTKKGVGFAAARKVMRGSDVRLARDVVELKDYVDRWGDEPDWICDGLINRGWKILMETSQGFDLDINHGLEYPYCTSRQCSASQALADAGLPPFWTSQVYGVVRPYPIRVGNTEPRVGFGGRDGWSGPYWRDNKETSWEHVAHSAGMTPEQTARMLEQEVTTVTGRQRRVFTFSKERMRHFTRMVGATSLILAFADQLDASCYGHSHVSKLGQPVRDFIAMLDAFEVPVRFVSTGPDVTQMVDLSESVSDDAPEGGSWSVPESGA